MKIHYLNGPNLNQLGKRQPHLYGTQTLDQIAQQTQQHAATYNIQTTFRQTNSESQLIDWIHQTPDQHQYLIINPAAYTHTSIALRDAIASIPTPTIEIHLTNIHAREPFRHKSLLAPHCLGQITGFGPHTYLLALDACRHHHQTNQTKTNQPNPNQPN